MAIDYTRRDFNTIKDDLLRRASTVLPEWSDRDPSDFGMLFVDLWAYMGDVLNYYIDRASQEAFLTTATQRESVLAIANLMDYRPASRTAAQSTVTITSTDPSNTVVIPKYTKLQGKDGTASVTCYTLEAVTIGPSTSTSVLVNEGTYYEDVQVSSASGLSSQSIVIPNTKVVTSRITVNVKEDGVNKTEYRFVNSLSEASYGEKVYTLYTDANGSTSIIFGNNINGFIPPVNSPIYISYATSSGKSGNYGSNVVTTFYNTNFIIPPAYSSSFTITGSTPFVGGVDEESVESMRITIPRATRSQNRAVTLTDFIDLTLGVPGIYKATASYDAGTVTVYPVVGQSLYTTNTAANIPITTDVETVVLDALQPKALLGVTVAVADNIPLIGVNIAADIHVNERYTRGWVVNDVRNAINNLLSFDNVYFNQRLTLSTLYHTIMGVEGVDYAEVTTFSTVSTSGIEDAAIPVIAAPTSLLRIGDTPPELTGYGGITTAEVPGG